jgi:hypothetical protein
MTYSYTQISQYLTCPRRYRHRYLDGWKEKDTRAAMLFGRAFEQALGAYFRREDPGAILFREWSACKDQSLQFSKSDSSDRMLEQGIMLLTRFCQDDRVRIQHPVQPADQVYPGRRKKRIRRLHRRNRETGRDALSARMEDVLEPISGGTPWAAGSRPTTGLLFVDDRHPRSRSGGIRPQTTRRGAVPTNHHYRRATPGIRPTGARHHPPDRSGPVLTPQRNSFPAEPLQQLSVRGTLSRTKGHGPSRSGAAAGSRRPWLA